MKRWSALAVLAAALGAGVGCLGPLVSQKEVEEKKSELVKEYRAQNNAPVPTPVPPEVEKMIDEKVEAWRVEEEARRKAFLMEKSGGILTNIAGGNWLGAVLMAVGLVGVGMDGWKAVKKGA